MDEDGPSSDGAHDVTDVSNDDDVDDFQWFDAVEDQNPGDGYTRQYQTVTKKISCYNNTIIL